MVSRNINRGTAPTLSPNLELSKCEPFWENRLCDEPLRTVRFQIGDVQIEGVNPCSQCVVPTRNPITAEITPKFQRHFAEQRQATLPTWAIPEAFAHFYKLSVIRALRNIKQANPFTSAMRFSKNR